MSVYQVYKLASGPLEHARAHWMCSGGQRGRQLRQIRKERLQRRTEIVSDLYYPRTPYMYIWGLQVKADDSYYDHWSIYWLHCGRSTIGFDTQHTLQASILTSLTGTHLPEWLPIYHTGNASIALTSAAKIFAFSFIGLASTVIAPIFYQVGVEAVAEGYSPWLKYILPAAIMSAATLPLYVTVFSPSASVTYIQIALPAAARRSRGALQAWARRIPGNTRLLITTQRASLNARQTLTCMDELNLPAVMGRPDAGRADVVAGPGSAPRDSNVLGVAGSATSRDYGTLPLQIMRQRLPGWQPPLNTGRLRWFAREPRLFVVRARINKAKELMVWDRFVEQIRRR